MTNVKIFSVRGFIRSGAIETLAEHVPPLHLQRTAALVFTAATSKKVAVERIKKTGTQFLVLDVKAHEYRASSLAASHGLVEDSGSVYATTPAGGTDTPVIAFSGHNATFVPTLQASRV